jgi:tetratricopeptide (TPR) repeat protein
MPRQFAPYALPVLLLIASAQAGGCSPPVTATPAQSAQDLLARSQSVGLSLYDPLVIDDVMKRDVEAVVGTQGEPKERMRRMVRYLNDRTFGFEYRRGTTISAREAFHKRRGDCLTYAILFVALSRHVELDTYFVHVSEVASYYDRNDSLYASSHVAVGYGSGVEPIVVDITREVQAWRMADYTRIEDSAAIALYFSNLSMDAMVAGDTERAVRTLSFLVRQQPGLEELHNNYAVALLRAHRAGDALSVIEHAMDRFPGYAPLYTNGIHAALRAHMPELARTFEARGQQIEATDPLFIVARATRLYERGDLRGAVREFERALDAAPDSPVVTAWLIRAHVALGEWQEGKELMQRLKGRSDAVLQLEAEYPALRGAAP